VRPDWMTPNTKYPYFLGMRGIGPVSPTSPSNL
jgi:hypothetical protein